MGLTHYFPFPTWELERENRKMGVIKTLPLSIDNESGLSYCNDAMTQKKPRFVNLKQSVKRLTSKLGKLPEKPLLNVNNTHYRYMYMVYGICLILNIFF